MKSIASSVRIILLHGLLFYGGVGCGEETSDEDLGPIESESDALRTPESKNQPNQGSKTGRGAERGQQPSRESRSERK